MDTARIAKLLRETCKLNPADEIVVGVSGGADSLTLLEVLLDLGYRPLVGHLDHMLRPSSRQEAELVASTAARKGLFCEVGAMDVTAFARENHLSIEEAARRCRYGFLFSLAKKNNCRAVLVAHTADDQVETVLMHLLRGSGMAGMQGMEFCSRTHSWGGDIPLVRPLLDTWRFEIMAFCRERDLRPVTDESNLDPAYLRNRIRHELIPSLQSYNPSVKQAVQRLAANTRQEYAVVQEAVQTAWQECLRLETAQSVTFPLEKFCSYPQGIQGGLLRRALGRLLNDLSDLDQAAVQRGLDFAGSPRVDKRIELTGGILLFVEADELILARSASVIMRDWPLLGGCREAELPLPGCLALENGWYLMAEVLNRGQAQVPCGELHAYLDHDAVTLPISVRCRQPGDRFQPLGMGHSRLSDFMINEKIPQRARSEWPLVCSGGQIMWVAGVRQSEAGKIKEDTEKVIHLYLQKGLDLQAGFQADQDSAGASIAASWRNFMLTSRH